MYWKARKILLKFLLTHPVWDVTLPSFLFFASDHNFYSHIPCGMWPSTLFSTIPRSTFLLTHPVWDVTRKIWGYIKGIKFLLTHPVWDVTSLTPVYRRKKTFLLTHPVWDVTVLFALLKFVWQISTHTSRVGCDHRNGTFWERMQDFYSHIPCGMWPWASRQRCGRCRISTHTSRVGCDRCFFQRPA